MERSWPVLVGLLALSVVDVQRVSQLERWHRLGMTWGDLGRALVLEEKTHADLGEIVGLRRDGYDWMRLEDSLSGDGMRDAPAPVPTRQDELLWKRGGFDAPGAERQRAPGEPGTTPPSGFLLPPGGVDQPGGPPEAGPELPR